MASERAPRPASIEEFGVEFDRDLVEVVEGKPTDKVFGPRIRGGTSLRASVEMAMLGQRLDRAGKEFASDAYKKVWPEIDNLVPVADEKLSAKLDDELDGLLKTKAASSRVILFTPSSARGETVVASSYVFGALLGVPVHRPYLTFEGWRQAFEKSGKPLSTESARASKVHMFNDQKEHVGECTAYESFGCEVDLGGATYVLSSGMWYNAAQDFIKKVNGVVKGIDAPSIPLPTWDQVESEATFNERAAKQSKSLVFDAKFTHFGGGQSKFEFCDFMHETSRTLFFAKIASRSSGMSHLLEQTRRTAELLFGLDGAYRRKLQKRIVKWHPSADVHWLDSRPNQGDWNLCLVALGRKADELPFFAKCGLAKMVQDLRVRGYNLWFVGV